MKDGESTHAAYVCATSNNPVKINDLTNNELGIKGKMTSIIPGAGCEVTMFSKDHSQGMQEIYTSKFHPVLNLIPELDFGNDAIVSMRVESDLDSYKLPIECHHREEA
jgi:hypothetical protein